MKNVVVIGGGTGVFTVLSGLKEYPYNLSAIVSMADDGGSTGVLREEFGILPPGDIRRVLVALSYSDNKILSELFNYRFGEGKTLKGHSLGNILLTALERITGSFDKAVKAAVKILNVRGKIIPVTLSNTRLYAELQDGKIIEGETNIDIPKHDGGLKIKRVFLKPQVSANKDAIMAILKAHVVILGPGDLYTSIIPNIIVDGVRQALRDTKAQIVYVVNIMNKFGETNEFRASDFLSTMEGYVGGGVIDYCIINTGRPKKELLVKYEKEKYELVKFDKKNFKNKKVKVLTGGLLRRGQFLRHNPRRLAEVLASIIG